MIRTFHSHQGKKPAFIHRTVPLIVNLIWTLLPARQKKQEGGGIDLIFLPLSIPHCLSNIFLAWSAKDSNTSRVLHNLDCTNTTFNP